jgi:hypothetical protein
MRFSASTFAAIAACVSRVAALASTDSISDADPAQSGYLPNHNMDPAVVDSAQFGQLWKIQNNFQELVIVPNAPAQTTIANMTRTVLRQTSSVHTQRRRTSTSLHSIVTKLDKNTRCKDWSAGQLPTSTHSLLTVRHWLYRYPQLYWYHWNTCDRSQY